MICYLDSTKCFALRAICYLYPVNLSDLVIYGEPDTCCQVTPRYTLVYPICCQEKPLKCFFAIQGISMLLCNKNDFQPFLIFLCYE